MEEGLYKGHQAVLILPAKPFRLMELSKENRTRILRFLLAPQAQLGGKIIISSSQGRGNFSANNYTNGIKNRLAVLLVNREVMAILILLYSILTFC